MNFAIFLSTDFFAFYLSNFGLSICFEIRAAYWVYSTATGGSFETRNPSFFEIRAHL
jgi:hypothetical protein